MTRDYSAYKTVDECVYEPWPNLKCDRSDLPKASHEKCYRCRGITASEALAEARASDKSPAHPMGIGALLRSEEAPWPALNLIREALIEELRVTKLLDQTASEIQRRHARITEARGRLRFPTLASWMGDLPPMDLSHEADAVAYAYTTMHERVQAKPPTLREWLGSDNVAVLGEWADVLREQPVPAGWVTEWQWDEMYVSWRAHGDTIHGPKSFTVVPSDIVSAVRGDRVPAHDAYLMCFFTRHPRVKPEPRKAPYPWSPEDQHDTIARDA